MENHHSKNQKRFWSSIHEVGQGAALPQPRHFAQCEVAHRHTAPGQLGRPGPGRWEKNLGTLGIYFQWEDMVIIGDI